MPKVENLSRRFFIFGGSLGLLPFPKEKLAE